MSNSSGIYRISERGVNLGQILPLNSRYIVKKYMYKVKRNQSEDDILGDLT